MDFCNNNYDFYEKDKKRSIIVIKFYHGIVIKSILLFQKIIIIFIYKLDFWHLNQGCKKHHDIFL